RGAVDGGYDPAHSARRRAVRGGRGRGRRRPLRIDDRRIKRDADSWAITIDDRSGPEPVSGSVQESSERSGADPASAVVEAVAGVLAARHAGGVPVTDSGLAGERPGGRP